MKTSRPGDTEGRNGETELLARVRVILRSVSWWTGDTEGCLLVEARLLTCSGLDLRTNSIEIQARPTFGRLFRVSSVFLVAGWLCCRAFETLSCRKLS
eukprot:2753080-Rhodomonas_salina.2